MVLPGAAVCAEQHLKQEETGFDAFIDGSIFVPQMHDANEISPGHLAVEAWFCVRTHPKHEHIAASQLRQEPDVKVFLPRIRYRRSTRFGPAWITEALFKDYIFARFNLAAALRRVQYSRSVRGIVRFGDRWPAVPDQIISELIRAMGGEDLRVIDETLQEGDLVQFAAGAMHGLQAVVTRVMPARQRVAVLLEFLGQQTTVEVPRVQLTFVSQEEGQRVRIPVWQTAPVPEAAFG
jgi:transcriptional antiterminator RfaH